MEITEDQMEWATVHRMREMLVNVHDKYKVTHTYALFTTILCWVMQRIRSSGIEDLDKRARSVHETLSEEPISEKPWNISTTVKARATHARPGYGPFTDFDGFDAAQLMEVLRNAQLMEMGGVFGL